MEYLVIGGILVAMGILIWVFKGNHETKAEQAENEAARKRASAAESFREQYDARERRLPPMPKVKPTRQAPPAAPSMRKLGGSSSAPTVDYGNVSPAPVRDTTMDMLTTVLLVDALTPDTVPEAEIAYVDAPYDHGKPDPAPERLSDPTPTYVEPDRTDYGSSSRSDDSGWSSSDNSSSSSSSDW